MNWEEDKKKLVSWANENRHEESSVGIGNLVLIGAVGAAAVGGLLYMFQDSEKTVEKELDIVGDEIIVEEEFSEVSDDDYEYYDSD